MPITSQTGADIEYQLLEAAKAGKVLQMLQWRHDIQHNDSQHNGTRYSVVMLSVTNKPFIVSVFMLNVVAPPHIAQYNDNK